MQIAYLPEVPQEARGPKRQNLTHQAPLETTSSIRMMRVSGDTPERIVTLYIHSLSIIHFMTLCMGDRRTGTRGGLLTPIPGKSRRPRSRTHFRRAENCRRIGLVSSLANCPIALKRYYGEVKIECVNLRIYSNIGLGCGFRVMCTK